MHTRLFSLLLLSRSFYRSITDLSRKVATGIFKQRSSISEKLGRRDAFEAAICAFEIGTVMLVLRLCNRVGPGQGLDALGYMPSIKQTPKRTLGTDDDTRDLMDQEVGYRQSTSVHSISCDKDSDNSVPLLTPNRRQRPT